MKISELYFAKNSEVVEKNLNVISNSLFMTNQMQDDLVDLVSTSLNMGVFLVMLMQFMKSG